MVISGTFIRNPPLHWALFGDSTQFFDFLWFMVISYDSCKLQFFDFLWFMVISYDSCKLHMIQHMSHVNLIS